MDEYEILILSSNLLFIVTYTYLLIAVETTRPPDDSAIENSSISVPPPQKDTLSGVRLIIIATWGAEYHSSRRRFGEIKEFYQ
jgi:hypothetical protein